MALSRGTHALTICPVSLKEANCFVEQYHRHHIKVQGHKFSIGIRDSDGHMRGVAIVGRPVSRHLDDGLTLEITRLCTDGIRNGCSKLYGAVRRIAREMGYKKVITYILEYEPGTSLKASGWMLVGTSQGGSWDTPSRRRDAMQYTLFGDSPKYPTVAKQRWEVKL